MPRDKRELVRNVVMEIARQHVRDDELLVSSGIIDSLRVLKLISRLEDQLQIRIPTDQVQPEDFDSVDLILETIERVAVLLKKKRWGGGVSWDLILSRPPGL